MSDLSLPARDSVAAQAEMFRRAAAAEGLTIAVLHARNQRLSKSTMRDWSTGNTAMPAWAIGALGEAGVPDELLSLVLDPFRRHVGTDEEGEGDLDDAALAAHDLSTAVQRARHPRSPGGVAIVHSEKAEIIPLALRAAAKARRAAA
jgi:hypothetical protein